MVVALLRAGRGRHPDDDRPFADAAQLLSAMRERPLRDDNSRSQVQNVRGDGLLRQKPSQCKLRRRGVLLSRKPFQHVDERRIRCKVLGREAVEPRSEVRFWVERRVSIHRPRQVAHSQRTPWDEADSQLLAGCKHAVPFWISFHERVFGLNGCHRLNRVRSADCFRTRLGEAEVQHLALLDEVLDCTSHLFESVRCGSTRCW